MSVLPDEFFRAYLTSYTFWLSLTLGSLGIALLQFLTGGIWGLATRRIFEAAAATLPLLAVLFLPLLAGLPRLYEWARPAAVAADPLLQHKAVFLNVPFFVARSLVYLVAWFALATLLLRWSAAQDRDPDPRVLHRLRVLSVVGVLVLAITVTFAAIDWLMSLEPRWFSTMYPPLVGMSGLLAALSGAIVTLVIASPRTRLNEIVTPRVLNDLGSLLLAFVMLWAYLAYFQYLLIWAGNLSDEIPWYLSRTSGGWRNVAIAIALLGFALPFWLLLFRPLKRRATTLAAVAGLLIVMRVVDVHWMVDPAWQVDGPSLSWLDVASLLGIGGMWLVIFWWRLATRPILPQHDPRLEAAHAAH
jgi:hypothetical protein